MKTNQTDQTGVGNNETNNEINEADDSLFIGGGIPILNPTKHTYLSICFPGLESQDFPLGDQTNVELAFDNFAFFWNGTLKELKQQLQK